MSTKKELRDEVLAEMNARRIDHKTYIDSEWLLSEYETTLRKEQEEAVAEAVKRVSYEIVKEFKDSLITIAIENKHMRGCVTSNQIIEAFADFEASTHEALTPQNTKTDTTNSDKRDEDQHREQCEGRY